MVDTVQASGSIAWPLAILPAPNTGPFTLSGTSRTSSHEVAKKSSLLSFRMRDADLPNVRRRAPALPWKSASFLGLRILLWVVLIGVSSHTITRKPTGSAIATGRNQSTSWPQHACPKTQARQLPSTQNGSGGVLAFTSVRIRAIVSSSRNESAGENSTWCREPPARMTIPYGGRTLYSSCTSRPWAANLFESYTDHPLSSQSECATGRGTFCSKAASARKELRVSPAMASR
jgi:hypothetical protein